MPQPRKRPPSSAPPFNISAEMVARSRARAIDQQRAAFLPAQHPPKATPPRQTMAMDDNMSSVIGWSQGYIQSAFVEGQAFLGYPELSILAQRSEYRVIVETIATEMTRKWIRFTAKGDSAKTAEIQDLEDQFEKLKVRDAFRKCAEQDGFFGRSHLYLDFGNTDNPDELVQPYGDGWNDVSRAKVQRGSLRRLKTVEPVWCYPTQYNTSDPLKDDWYRPDVWFALGKQIHRSQFLTFIGHEVPDMLKPAYSFGGLSMSQMAKPYVDNWLRTRQSVADLIHSFSVMVLKTNLAAGSMMGGEELYRRIDLFNNLRDNRGTMICDKETEDLTNVSASLASLDALQAQTQEHMAAVSRIPLVKLTGISPSGLNASSEGEIRVFYDVIESYQSHFFRDNLRKVLGFVMLSAWGYVDPDISFEFESLWSLDEKAQADVRKAEAETGQILIDSGVISPQEERGRVAEDVNSPYSGLDVDEMPDPEEVAEQVIAVKGRPTGAGGLKTPGQGPEGGGLFGNGGDMPNGPPDQINTTAEPDAKLDALFGKPKMTTTGGTPASPFQQKAKV